MSAALCALSRNGHCIQFRNSDPRVPEDWYPMILPCVSDDGGYGDGGCGGDGGGRSRAWTACSTSKRGRRKGEEPQYPCSKVWNINIVGIGGVSLPFALQQHRAGIATLQITNKRKNYVCWFQYHCC